MPNEPNHEVCAWCDAEVTEEDMDNGDYRITIQQDGICIECYESEGTDCYDCEGIVHETFAVLIGYHYQVCEDCYYESYFFCEGCDERMHNRHWAADGYCSSCYDHGDCDCGECHGNEHEGIRSWGDQPDLMFWNKVDDGGLGWDYNYTARANTWYMGMEIELEQAGFIGQVMHEVTDHMWATTDSSLDSGVEVVTMPHTFEAWNDVFPWDWWRREVHDKAPDQEQWDTNGIHIHVSRSAFKDSKGKDRASHLYKFMQFIQVNEGGIQELAGRNGNTYCNWGQQRDGETRLSDAKKATSTDSTQRYRPINTQNGSTIELRFFAGLSDPAFMKRALQFTHSVVEFTRTGGFKKDRTWESWVEYVEQNSSLYPELDLYLAMNKRRLMVKAVTSELYYADKVKPMLKQRRKEREERKQREQRRLALEQSRQVLEAAPYEVNIIDACTCHACIRAREQVAAVLEAATFNQ